jgi:LPXTG-motif cell wall-anchored protein
LTNLGFSRDIIVNHSRIPPLSAYQVPLSVYYNHDLRIYNCQRGASANTITNGKNGGSQSGYLDKGSGNYKTNNANHNGIKGLLPQTGEQQLKFSLLGIALILLGIIIYVFNHRRGEIKNEK